MTQESRLGDWVPAGLGCANMPGMGEQAESPTVRSGDRCPFCGGGTLVPSPSGLNLLCRTCDRITLLPQAHRPNGRPDAMRHGRIPGRRRKHF
jgi:hypothetical protein